MGRVMFNKHRITYGNQRGSYMTIHLNERPYFVHRLICQAFKKMENFENYVVNHIDNNGKNNNINNLEWLTVSQNNKYHYENGFGGRKIVQLTIDNEYIKIYDNQNKASRELGGDPSGISRACKGKQKTALGFKWMFLDEYETLTKV
jgi:hypothetical protein